MRRIPIVVVLAGVLAAAAWAQEKKKEDVEGKVRAAAFGYFSATALGDAESLLKVARHPLLIIKDGAVANRSEKESRNLLAGVALKLKEKAMTNEDKGKLLGTMIQVFDEASVQFVGASTAHLTFVMKFGTRETGDALNTLLLTRNPQGGWKVFGEITDSAPVPPAYLGEMP